MTPTGKPSLRLLLVEDHEDTLKILSRLLTREGHQVVPARTFAEAVESAAANKFDVVVSDLTLPDGLGTTLMLTLKSTHGLPGIALSGHGEEEDLVRSREAGFFAHLVKPVDFAALRAALGSVNKTPAA